MDASSIKFGPGATREVGEDMRALGAQRVMVVTDPHLATLEPVAVALDPASRVSEIVSLLPATENVFVVVGGGAIGRFWRGELERESSQFHGRLRFIWPDNMSYAAMLQRASTLPAHSVIFFTSTFESDAVGATYSAERVLDDLHARANAPIVGMQSVEIGHGAGHQVGERLRDGHEPPILVTAAFGAR